MGYFKYPLQKKIYGPYALFPKRKNEFLTWVCLILNKTLTTKVMKTKL